MQRRLYVIAALVLLLLLAGQARPVLAHAELVQSVPEANAILEQPPAQIELIFTEGLEPSFSRIEVLDINGQRMDNGDNRLDPNDPTRLTVSLRSLPDGVYTVSWQVLSTVDGHVTSGAFPFAVGSVDAASLAAAGEASRQVRLSPGEVINRWLTYLAAATLVGGVLFILLVWRPAYEAAYPAAPQPDPLQPTWSLLAHLALVVLGVATILALLLQAGQAAGIELAAPWNPAAGNLLSNTRYGALWLTRITVIFAFAWFIRFSASGMAKEGQRSLVSSFLSANSRWLALILAMVFLLTISLGSHAAAEPQPTWPILADWLHLMAASVWVGGLVHFAACLWVTPVLPGETVGRTRLVANLIPRFSALALTSVAILLFTGLYATVLRVGSWEALANNLYGRTLVVKLLLVLPMLVLGAVNLLLITGRMKQAAAAGGNVPLINRFRQTVSGEVVLGMLVLLSVGLLTSIPPARAATSNPLLQAEAQADDLALELSVSPGRAGINTFTLDITADGQPVVNATEVSLRFTALTGDIPTSELPLTEQGNGRYTAQGSNLSLPRTWQVQAAVRREGEFDAFANFDFELGTAATRTAFAWHRLAAGLLLAAAFLYLLAQSGLQRRVAGYVALGVLPALLLAWVGVAVYSRVPAAPAAPAAALVNPIPPNADSLAAGKVLYQQNCLACHGPTGQGDGPVGVTLNPRPADLTIHTTSGVHPDGQLYEWITFGFPGSVMPAFEQQLSEEERWHLVNYIRTLATP